MGIYDFSSFKNSSLAETVSYTPSGGSAKPIKAVVFRQGSKQVGGARGAEIQYYPVVVEIDRVDVPIVVENEDKIVCLDANGTSKSFRVSKILSSDPGCFKLGLGL